jgi:hypothetical protein
MSTNKRALILVEIRRVKDILRVGAEEGIEEEDTRVAPDKLVITGLV